MSKLLTVLAAALLLNGCSTLMPLSTRGATKPLDLTGVTRVNVITFDGNVRITNDARVTNAGAVALTLRGNTGYRVERVDGTLFVRGFDVGPWVPGHGVDVTLTLPAGIGEDVVTTNGAVVVTGGAPEVTARTTNGPVSVAGVGASTVKVASTNADVTVRDVTGPVEVSTTNGAASVLDVTLPAASLSSVESTNGPVRMSGLRVPSGVRITADGEAGRTHVTWPDATVRVDGGHAEVEVPGVAPATVKLSTTNDGINVTE
ncbi:DUF4097 family beta strand repeat-containing protein [Deinococcus pimensis]|uniref:DUF4097 family beta strand repeat-containing protein n=1 Tax=Deinococcus pimensis TaxID=309888 RepID=UPI000481AF01|nr:DUF4097 family beta strand repeat-containing protein [Deinococcus pimensis]